MDTTQITVIALVGNLEVILLLLLVYVLDLDDFVLLNG